MRGRIGTLLVREAVRQIYGVQRAPSTSFVLKYSTVANFQSLHSTVTWNGTTLHGNEISRAWSPFMHHMSTAAAPGGDEMPSGKPSPAEDPANVSKTPDLKKNFDTPTDISSYWGVVPKVQYKDDGTPWKWTCFTPHETYYPDVTIDLEKRHERKTMTDSIAYWTVKSMRIPTDLFFQKRYGCRAMMLETVAAVPGMVGGMLLHCKSLRRFETSGGWIKALLEEAENERMHLMTFMEVAQPKWYERALVFAVQGVFFNAYFLLYLVSPRLAHRITGYLEEEAIWSYTQFLKEIDAGRIENVPAPAIAIDYWRLPKDATIRDVCMVVRADEAHHRDVNHFAADIHENGKQLRDSPAPVGYH
jgi:ubiquinol oxidase